jgi:hypothetical protein
MALLFDNSNSEYMIVLSAIRTSTPLSMACWFKSDDLTAGQSLMSIANNNSDVHYHALSIRGDVYGHQAAIDASTLTAAIRARITLTEHRPG